jgi:hypothetical protein
VSLNTQYQAGEHRKQAFEWSPDCLPHQVNSANSTFKLALMLMSGRMFAFTIIFLVPIILVRIFSTPEFGAYRQFFLITHTLLTVVQLGFAESLFYFLSGNRAQAGRFVEPRWCHSILEEVVTESLATMSDGPSPRIHPRQP